MSNKNVIVDTEEIELFLFQELKNHDLNCDINSINHLANIVFDFLVHKNFIKEEIE
jgi:hypothetical protein